MGRFCTILKLVKNLKKIKSFYGCNIQVSVHLSLYWRGQHICQRGDIPSRSAPVFAPGHCMGRFAPFELGSTQNLHL